MAKKKGNALFAAVSKQDTAQLPTPTTANSVQAAVEKDEANNVSDELVSSTIADSDDELAVLKAEVLRLNEVNAQLTDKLAAYIEENAAEKSNLEKSSSISVELELLRSEMNGVRDEDDRYLRRISELTFENAKLNSQLQQLSKDTQQPQMQTQAKQSRKNAPSMKSSFVPYIKSNGYSDWN